MIPAVTVPLSPKGLPMAITQSPTRAERESPNFTKGSALGETIEAENLQQNALEIGAYLLAELGGVAQRFSQVGDVRGKGLYIGVELVRRVMDRRDSGAVEPWLQSLLSTLDAPDPAAARAGVLEPGPKQRPTSA